MTRSTCSRKINLSGAEGARGRGEDGGFGAQARRLRSNALQLEVQVRRHGCLRGQTVEAARGRECQAEEVIDRADAGYCRSSRASWKKMVGPAAKREGVAHLRATMGLSERRACSIVSADRKMVRYRLRRPPDTELRTQSPAISPTRGSVSDIVGCSSCCGRRASPRRQPRLPALSRRRPHGAQAAGPEARCGVAGADPCRIRLNARWSVDFVHDQLACVASAAPHSERRR